MSLDHARAMEAGYFDDWWYGDMEKGCSCGNLASHTVKLYDTDGELLEVYSDQCESCRALTVSEYEGAEVKDIQGIGETLTEIRLREDA